MNISNRGITTFGSSIINSFGINNRAALLPQMSGGLADTISRIGFGMISDKFMDHTVTTNCPILISTIRGIMTVTILAGAEVNLLVECYFISCVGAPWRTVMVTILDKTVENIEKATVD
ncbi:hypothetical protein K431DRAFT_330148, partial [Polychaeton citri CBS 116435]